MKKAVSIPSGPKPSTPAKPAVKAEPAEVRADVIPVETTMIPAFGEIVPQKTSFDVAVAAAPPPPP